MANDSFTLTALAPVVERGRIVAVDVIRGAALFGVLWMNLYAITTQLVPHALRDALVTAPIDRVVSLLSEWLVSDKAQTMFGMLFGFGFAVFIDRAAARGAAASTLFIRRLLFLLVLGMLHYVCLWWGDILHAYAVFGFALLLVRRWPTQLLASVGLCLIFLSPFGSWLAAAVLGDPDRHGLGVARTHFQATMWPAIRAGVYGDMVRAVRWRSMVLYGDGHVVGIAAMIFGQFLVGAALFRTGWLQNVEMHRDLFRRVAVICLPAGLVLAALDPARALIGHLPLPQPLLVLLGVVSEVVLGAGYAALLVLAAMHSSMRSFCANLAATGRMALTNYMMQSVFILVLIDGFGLGLIGHIGVALDGMMTLLLFALQMLFSRWWLERFNFGPLEWFWRSVTYGRWQVLKKVRSFAVS